MKPIEALYFDGKTSKHETVIFFFSVNGQNHRNEESLKIADTLTIQFKDGETKTYRLSEIRVQSRLGRVPRVIDLPDQSSLHVTDHKTLERELPEKKDFVHFLENNNRFVVGALLGLFVIFLFFYFVAIPVTSKILAPSFTKNFGPKITEQTLFYLRKTRIVTEPPEKYKDRMDSLRQFESLSVLKNYKLLVYDSETLDANAFALPDKTIVVTKQLLDILPDDLEVLSVILHEVGHIEKYHVMERLIGDSIVSFAVLAIFGADWTSLPLVVLTAGYSRSLENEADVFAARELIKNDLPVSLLSLALKKIDSNFKMKNDTGVLELFSTHPATNERVKNIEKLDTEAVFKK